MDEQYVWSLFTEQSPGRFHGIVISILLNGGELWTVPELLFESKKLIPELQPESPIKSKLQHFPGLHPLRSYKQSLCGSYFSIGRYLWLAFDMGNPG